MRNPLDESLDAADREVAAFVRKLGHSASGYSALVDSLSGALVPGALSGDRRARVEAMVNRTCEALEAHTAALTAIVAALRAKAEGGTS